MAGISRRRALGFLGALAAQAGAALTGCGPGGGDGGGGPGGGGLFGRPEFRSEETTSFGSRELDPIDSIPENSIEGPQTVDVATYRLRVKGLVERPREYTYAEVTRRPAEKRPLRIDCVEGWNRDLLREGVLLNAILDEAGVKSGARTVVFRAADGYSTSLALAYVRQRDLLLGFKVNGLTLPPERGYPLQVIAQGSWGYKWCKWLEEIELVADPGFEGYWESRGYSVDGSLDKPFFD